MQRSFSSLTAAEALQVAISIEQRNADVYHRFAEMFAEFGDDESLEIASVFWEMAVEEQGHRALLEEKYVQMFGPLGDRLTEQDVIELVEVPNLDSADIFNNDIEFGARQRALQVARKPNSGLSSSMSAWSGKLRKARYAKCSETWRGWKTATSPTWKPSWWTTLPRARPCTEKGRGQGLGVRSW